jgi:hypothetical protein
MRKSKEFFICQQGFPAPHGSPHLYSALMFQPRVIGGIVALGSILQSHELFLLLAAVLAWGTIAPRHNLFDALYNGIVAGPRGYPLLGPAPAPRRFAQGAAAVLALATGTSLAAGLTTVAWILEVIVLAAVASAVVRRFCLPAHLYFVLRRRLQPLSSVTATAAPPC